MSDTLTATSTTQLRTETCAHRLVVAWSPDQALVGREIQLEKKTLEIGRKVRPPHIAVDDRKASRVHARIQRTPRLSLYEIVDLRSKNKLFVNGCEVSRRLLADNDVIRVGNTLVVYEQVPADGPMAVSDGFVGESAAALRTIGLLLKGAPSKLTVLLTGETGTGKEVSARLVHQMSDRKGRFVAVNCAAIPDTLVESTLFGHARGAFTGATDHRDGLFVEAHGGTLFLDEVGEMPLAVQAKLLRVLEEGEVVPVGRARGRRVDVRVVAATNADIHSGVGLGTFRQDLLARLDQWSVSVPALRERRRDILVLARHFRGSECDLDADAAEALLVAPWTNNVRGLKTVLDRANLLADGGRITLAALPEAMIRPIRNRQVVPASASVAHVRPTEEELVESMRLLDGNITRVAAHFGKPRRQVYRWLDHYGLRRKAHDGEDG